MATTRLQRAAYASRYASVFSSVERVESILRLLGKRVGFWLVFTIVCSMTLAISELLIAGAIQTLLSIMGVIPKELSNRFSSLTITQFVLVFILIAFLRSLSQFGTAQSATEVMESMGARLKLLCVTEFLALEKPRYVASGIISLRLSELFPKTSTFIFFLSQFIALFVQCFVIGCILFYIAPQEALMGIVGLGLVAVVVRASHKKIQRLSTGLPFEQEALTKGIERSVRNWLPIHILRLNRAEHSVLSGRILNYTSIAIQCTKYNNFAVCISLFLGGVLLMAILWISSSYLKTEAMMLLAFFYLFVRFVQNLAGVVGWWGGLTHHYQYFMQSVEYFESYPESGKITALSRSAGISFKQPLLKETKTNLEKTYPSTSHPPAFQVRGISFSYASDSTKILDNVSFDIPAGSQFAIIGPSGSGKSTLLGLLMGILEPTTGKILVNGSPARTLFDTKNFRVGYVGPEPFLFRGTIYENLVYGLDFKVTAEQIEDALKHAGMLEFITSLPNAMEYKISESGDGISVGQKQRLALARALLGKPEILILDEASANLDDQTESTIVSSLRYLKGSCTIVMVSHRKNFIQFSDNILDLSKTQNTR